MTDLPEFTVDRKWNGDYVLLVRCFDTMPLTGIVQKVRARHLPEFFRQLAAGRKVKP